MTDYVAHAPHKKGNPAMSDTATNTPEREADPAPTKLKKPSWHDPTLDRPGDYLDDDNEPERPAEDEGERHANDEATV